MENKREQARSPAQNHWGRGDRQSWPGEKRGVPGMITNSEKASRSIP